MREELEEALYKDFPLTFKKRIYFEVGDGWEPLIRRGAQKIEELIKSLQVPEGEEPPYTVQCKEKFGTLRWYFDGFERPVWDIVREVENESCKTCESCGAEGKLRPGGWLRTLCDNCCKRD